jgi:hypothetical protein
MASFSGKASFGFFLFMPTNFGRSEGEIQHQNGHASNLFKPEQPCKAESQLEGEHVGLEILEKHTGEDPLKV